MSVAGQDVYEAHEVKLFVRESNLTNGRAFAARYGRRNRHLDRSGSAQTRFGR